MNRRSFFSGIIAAPVVITTPGLLMPVRQWINPAIAFPDTGVPVNMPQATLQQIRDLLLPGIRGVTAKYDYRIVTEFLADEI